MVNCILVAATEAAKSFKGPHGSADLYLASNTRLGRAPAQPGSYQLPQAWQQVSSNHCRVFCDPVDPDRWFIEDSSTNGTSLNKTKLVRNKPTLLKFGDRVIVSLPPAGAPASQAVEYCFQNAATLSDEVNKAVAAYNAHLRKRKEPAPQQANGVKATEVYQHPSKIARPSVKQESPVKTDAANMLAQQVKALRKEHDHLRAEEHARREVLEKRLQDNDIAHAEVKKLLEDKLRDADEKAREKLASQGSASEAAIKAARLEAKHSQAAAAAAEERLAGATDRAVQAEQQVFNLQANEAKLVERESQLTEALSKAEQEVTKLAAAHAAINHEVALLRRQLADRSEKLTTATAKLASQAERLEAEEAAVAAAQQHVSQMELEAKAARTAAEEERASRHAASDKVLHLQARLAEAQRTAQQAQEAEARARREAAVRQDLLGNVRREIDAALCQGQSLARRRAELEESALQNARAFERLAGTLGHVVGSDSATSVSTLGGRQERTVADTMTQRTMLMPESQRGDADRPSAALQSPDHHSLQTAMQDAPTTVTHTRGSGPGGEGSVSKAHTHTASTATTRGDMATDEVAQRPRSTGRLDLQLATPPTKGAPHSPPSKSGPSQPPEAPASLVSQGLVGSRGSQPKAGGCASPDAEMGEDTATGGDDDDGDADMGSQSQHADAEGAGGGGASGAEDRFTESERRLVISDAQRQTMTVGAYGSMG